MVSNVQQMHAKDGPQWSRWGAGMKRALERAGIPLEQPTHARGQAATASYSTRSARS